MAAAYRSGDEQEQADCLTGARASYLVCHGSLVPELDQRPLRLQGQAEL